MQFTRRPVFCAILFWSAALHFRQSTQQINQCALTITQSSVETRMLPPFSENFKAIDQNKSVYL